MPSFLAADAEAHVNVIRAAAPQYMSGFADLTQRSHILFALMSEQGMMEYNATAASTIYQIQVREPEVRTSNDSTRKVFQNSNVLEQCQVGVRWYEATDLLTEIQWKLNQGKTSLVNLYDTKMKNLGVAMARRLQEWAYRDGNVSPYTDGFQGFESCLAAGTVAAGDKIAMPSDSYAGHNTALADFGGTWSTDLAAADRPNATLANDWPFVQGTSNYDAFSPLLLNWSSTRWGSGSTLWVDNCEEVLREGSAIMQAKNGYMDTGDVPVVYLMAPNLYVQAKTFYSTRFRMAAPYREGEVGFPSKGTLSLDGVVLKSDYACPAGVFYGLCPQHMELFWMICRNADGENPMIDVDGPWWEGSLAAYLMRVAAGGNLRMQPKFMMKGKAYA